MIKELEGLCEFICKDIEMRDDFGYFSLYSSVKKDENGFSAFEHFIAHRDPEQNLISHCWVKEAPDIISFYKILKKNVLKRWSSHISEKEFVELVEKYFTINGKQNIFKNNL